LTSCYCRSLLLLVCLIFVLVVGSSSGGHGLEHHLAVLNEIVGVTGAKDFGTEGDRDKQFGVYLSLRTAPGRDGVSRIRVPCTAVIETKLDAALVARQKVAAALGPAGPAACEAAEQRVLAKLHGAGDASADASTAAAPTEEELEWLASWFDTHPDPSEITHAQAEAALLQHRKQQAGAATAARLMEAQVLQARFRAAELRFKRAEVDMRKAKAALPDAVEPQPKRARSGEPRPYEKWSDPLGEFIREEGMLWTRRRVELSADKAARPPEKMPRGKDAEGNERGPLRHWRRGLVFALQDWAEGSKADAAKLVFDLIEELELEVRLPLCLAGPFACSATLSTILPDGGYCCM